MWWQQAEKHQGVGAGDRMCLHGSAEARVTCTKAARPNGLVGGHRKSKPSPPFLTNRTEAAPGFDDSAWELVDAPHDFVARNGTITEGADSHRGRSTTPHPCPCTHFIAHSTAISPSLPSNDQNKHTTPPNTPHRLLHAWCGLVPEALPSAGVLFGRHRLCSLPGCLPHCRGVRQWAIRAGPAPSSLFSPFPSSIVLLKSFYI